MDEGAKCKSQTHEAKVVHTAAGSNSGSETAIGNVRLT